ncbi:hypothetical protein [Nocardia gipuzkoensis]|uniref:hypothetical protein n=1 Tax=Nocardia gipuzkoensis TaxID=2749991 RepID=UPI003EE10387
MAGVLVVGVVVAADALVARVEVVDVDAASVLQAAAPIDAAAMTVAMIAVRRADTAMISCSRSKCD